MLQANNLISDRIPDELFVGGTTVVVFFEYLTHLNDPLGSLIVYSATLADKAVVIPFATESDRHSL